MSDVNAIFAALTLEHARIAAQIKQLELEKKEKAVEIRDALGANGLDRWESEAFIVHMMYPAPRKVIEAEKLLQQGVGVDVIEKATKVTPVDPFVRVDARREKA